MGGVHLFQDREGIRVLVWAETDSLRAATIASPSASAPGGSHIATAAKSSKLHTVLFSNAAPPKAAYERRETASGTPRTPGRAIARLDPR